jgi:hypothetical protein
MLRYVLGTLSEWTRHPLLVSLVGIAACFLATGVVVDRLTGNAVASGFFGVYAVIALTLAGVGYAAFLGGRVVSAVSRDLEEA